MAIDAGLDSLTRAAQLTGYVRGLDHALAIIRRHHGASSPVASEVFNAIVSATEDAADMSVKARAAADAERAVA